MITVYGRATSSNVQLVMWALAEIGLDCERLDYGMTHGGTDTAEYRAMNPMGLVPVLREGDTVMFESAAILRYLGARYGSEGFWPADPARRGPLDTWAEWGKGTFSRAVLVDLFYPLVRYDPALLTPEAVTRGVAAVVPLATILNDRIGDGPWLGGDELCFADIVCGHILFRYFTLPFTRPDLPALAAYYDRLCARPEYARHVMVSYEPLRFRTA